MIQTITHDGFGINIPLIFFLDEHQSKSSKYSDGHFRPHTSYKIGGGILVGHMELKLEDI